MGAGHWRRRTFRCPPTSVSAKSPPSSPPGCCASEPARNSRPHRTCVANMSRRRNPQILPRKPLACPQPHGLIPTLVNARENLQKGRPHVERGQRNRGPEAHDHEEDPIRTLNRQPQNVRRTYVPNREAVCHAKTPSFRRYPLSRPALRRRHASCHARYIQK